MIAGLQYHHPTRLVALSIFIAVSLMAIKTDGTWNHTHSKKRFATATATATTMDHGYYKKKDPSPSHETDAAAARRVGLLREAKANQGDVRAVVLLVRALRERHRGNSHLHLVEHLVLETQIFAHVPLV